MSSAGAPRRGLAVVAVAALVGAPMLTGSAAGATEPAEPVAEQPAVITFSGGCGLLGIGGRSMPDVVTALVAAGSQLRFGNQLGQRATIWSAEQAKASVPAGGEADVTFPEPGTVPVTMRISCLLGQPVGVVSVEVVASAQDSPGSPQPPVAGPPAAPPSASAPADGLGTPTASAGAGGGDGVAPPGSGAVEDDGGTPPGGGSVSSPEGPGSVSSPDGPGSVSSPEGPGAGPVPGAESSSGGGQLESPADGPMSDLGVAESTPATDRSSGVEGGAELGGEVTVNPPNVGQSGDVAPASRTRGDDGVVGLLALVATVCLVGASVGAVRVLVSRRVSAAKWA